MDYRVDEKGKYYTNHINKRTIPVVVEVDNNIVRGIVHLTLDNRLKDELNADENFIAITQAQVYERGTERLLYKTDVVIVNKQRIVWIFPRESSPPDGNRS